jgi:hypothetical protein
VNENLDAFLADFAVPVVAGSASGLGLFEMPTQTVGNGLSLSNDYSVTVKAVDFPALKFNDTITVNEASFKVRQSFVLDDGSFVRVVLSKV